MTDEPTRERDLPDERETYGQGQGADEEQQPGMGTDAGTGDMGEEPGEQGGSGDRPDAGSTWGGMNQGEDPRQRPGD